MEFSNHVPFAQALGFKLVRQEGGEAEIAHQLAPDHMNASGNAHGGVLMTLLDVVMANAARSQFRLPEGAPPGTKPDLVATIEMKTSFMRPGQGRIVAHGKVLTQTLTMSFCEGAVRDADGKLLAHATGTFKRLKSKPA